MSPRGQSSPGPRRRSNSPLSFALLLVFISCSTARAELTVEEAKLRKQVIDAPTDDEKADAYRALFTKLGLSRLKDLTRDADDGIALQAAWETSKKAIQRPKLIRFRVDHIYDKDELSKFVSFVRERTKAPIPKWWAEDIVNVDLFPGVGPGFPGENAPHFSILKTPIITPKGAVLQELGEELAYSAGGKKVCFEKGTFEAIANAFTGIIGNKRSFIAGYMSAVSYPYQLASFTENNKKAVWKSDVWGCTRRSIGGVGFHFAELGKKGELVLVFGEDSYGMYLEAFNETNGKCLYRFCTTYWDHASEQWRLK